MLWKPITIPGGFLIIKLFNLSGVGAGVMLIQSSMPSAILTYLIASMYSPKEIVDNIKEIDTSKVKYLTGRAGSITIHNSRTIHSSPASKSRRPRPVLLNCYSSADAKPYTPHPDPSINANTIVRGERALWAHHDPRPCRIPPDWSGGYTSIYAAQAGEDK